MRDWVREAPRWSCAWTTGGAGVPMSLRGPSWCYRLDSPWNTGCCLQKCSSLPTRESNPGNQRRRARQIIMRANACAGLYLAVSSVRRPDDSGTLREEGKSHPEDEVRQEKSIPGERAGGKMLARLKSSNVAWIGDGGFRGRTRTLNTWGSGTRSEHGCYSNTLMSLRDRPSKWNAKAIVWVTAVD